MAIYPIKSSEDASFPSSPASDLKPPFATHPALRLPPLRLNPAWRSALTQRHVGLQVTRRFYAPDYAEASARESRLPDYRHTLLWLPAVETNGSTTVTLPFSTSDLTGRYRVTVEGITREGLHLSGRISLLVEE